jgi:hypothetical protein
MCIHSIHMMSPGRAPSSFRPNGNFLADSSAVWSCGMIFLTSATASPCGIATAAQSDPKYRQLYFEKYVALNPTLTPRCFAAVEKPTATADLIPYDEVPETRFYLEWAKPQRLIDFVSIFLEKATAKAACSECFGTSTRALSTRKRAGVCA